MQLDRDLYTTLDLTPEEVRSLLDDALALKRGEKRAALAGRVAALLFFNPSVRTRVSCESAMARYGGTAIAINPGKDTWNFESREGIVMDGNTQEHVRELAPVGLQFLKSPDAGSFDIVFLDPPFAADSLDELCRLLDEAAVLKRGSLIYLEDDRTRSELALVPEWQLIKSKTAGNVRYSLVQSND